MVGNCAQNREITELKNTMQAIKDSSITKVEYKQHISTSYRLDLLRFKYNRIDSEINILKQDGKVDVETLTELIQEREIIRKEIEDLYETLD